MTEHNGDEEHLLTHHVGGSSIICSCGKVFGTTGEAQQHQYWHLHLQSKQEPVKVNKTPDSVDVEAAEVNLPPSDEALMKLKAVTQDGTVEPDKKVTEALRKIDSCSHVWEIAEQSVYHVALRCKKCQLGMAIG
jgi:hypothetical protein